MTTVFLDEVGGRCVHCSCRSHGRRFCSDECRALQARSDLREWLNIGTALDQMKSAAVAKVERVDGSYVLTLTAEVQTLQITATFRRVSEAPSGTP
jgi:hypothetical protein